MAICESIFRMLGDLAIEDNNQQYFSQLSQPIVSNIFFSFSQRHFSTNMANFIYSILSIIWYIILVSCHWTFSEKAYIYDSQITWHITKSSLGSCSLVSDTFISRQRILGVGIQNLIKLFNFLTCNFPPKNG